MSPDRRNSSTIRAFIAIELPAEVRHGLAAIERQLQIQSGVPKAVRWVPTENMHLTLKFLGEVSSSSLQVLAGRLQNAVSRQPAFSFNVGGLGAFPNPRRPRVIWIGSDAPAALANLQKAVETEASQLGYPADERPFSPHLTLGRVNQHARPDEISQIAQTLGKIKIETRWTVQVSELHLFRSDLRPTGAVYSKLYSFSLGTSEAG